MNISLGIDLGTSATKVLALGETGEVIAKSSAPYPLLQPAVGWSEQRPSDWWRAVCGAVGNVLKKVEIDRVTGVALSGQLNGVVLLDAHKEPLGNALIWLDQRATAEAAWLNEHYAPKLRQAVFNPANPIYVASKLLWLKNERPELLTAAHHIVFAKDYLNFLLSGQLATDYSDASCTLLFDLTRGGWIPELLELLGLEPQQLPRLHSSLDIIGHITPGAAAATGLPQGIPVMAGAGDVAALAVGSGAIEPGLCSVTLGTAGHVATATQALSEVGFNQTWQMFHAAPGRYINLGLVMSGGLSLSWFRRELGELETERAKQTSQDPFEQLVARAEASEPGARGITFLPFLEGAATPFQNPNLRASFVNLSSSHHKGDLVQAVLEGVAYNIRDCIQIFEASGAKIDEIRLSEGGSRSARWCQIIADVLSRPLYTLTEIDTSALGAAIIALATTSQLPLSEAVTRVVRVKPTEVIRPNLDLLDLYDRGYARYRKLAKLLESAF